MDARPTRQVAEQAHGAVTPPIVRSSTFIAASAAELAARFAGEQVGPIYSRLSNPTVDALEAALAEAEGAEGAVATASGMGAIHAALMSLLKPGSRMVVDHCVYGCTYSLLEKLSAWGVEIVRADVWDAAAFDAALEGGADVVFAETPMNPTLRCIDIGLTAAKTHAAGGLLVIDNTFATPVVQRPLEWGADLVVHSLTKGINGHSDLLAGAVIGAESLLGGVREWRKDAGAVLDPDTAWLCYRGMQTMDLRVRAQCASAFEIAQRLSEGGRVVHHPLLAAHPDHELAVRQMPLGVSVVALDLGTQEAAYAFIDALRVFRNAVSLGGFESLVCHPASTTHATIPETQRRAGGITAGLVRLSVGVEPLAALIGDIEQALSAPGQRVLVQ